jgi:hypothetical protein
MVNLILISLEISCLENYKSKNHHRQRIKKKINRNLNHNQALINFLGLTYPRSINGRAERNSFFGCLSALPSRPGVNPVRLTDEKKERIIKNHNGKY